MEKFCSVQLFSCVRLFTTPWTAALQASLSITNPQSLLKLMSMESAMPSNHLILCCPLLLLLSIFPSIRVFSNTTVQKISILWHSAFFIVQISHPYMTTGKTIALTRKKVKSLSRVRLFATPWTIAHQAAPSMGFSRREYCSGVPSASPYVTPSR